MLDNITPKGKQREVLALPPTGHYVVLGTAGSGKTTMALLRAELLASLSDKPSVLVVTFNVALVNYMEMLAGDYPRNITIEHFHKFARGYLNSIGKMPQRNGIVDPGIKSCLIQRALDKAKAEYPDESTFKRPLAVFVDEISFLEKFGITREDEYCSIERIGRKGANIKRENRRWFFKIYKDYLELRQNEGYCYDWDDLACYVYQTLQTDERDRRYKHIIVDEGQDFSPMMLKALTAAVDDNGSFTFFGDVAQQIYGSRLSWRDAGIKAVGIWKFDRNYRNPSTVTTFAKDLMSTRYWESDDDIITPSFYTAIGPKPVLIGFPDQKSELTWLASQLESASEASNIVICRNRGSVGTIRSFLSSKGLICSTIDKDSQFTANVKGIFISTFHSAKGLEYDNVFIPFLSEGIFPDPEAVVNARTEDEAYASEMKLLYVASTRSKYGLYMSYHGSLSPLFPTGLASCDYFNGDEFA